MESAIYDKSGPDNYKVQPLSALTPWYAFLSAAKCKNHALILQRAELFVMGVFLHCVKSVQIWSYFWSVFSCIWIEYGYLRIKSPYSIRIQENTDQK